jgi:hypothetical protein
MAPGPRDSVPLRDHLEARLDSLEARFCECGDREQQRHEAQAIDARKAAEEARYALEKAEKALDVRLDGMNQFRQQITNERGEYVTRSELALQIQALKAEMKPLQVQSDRYAGGYAVLAAIVAFILSIAGLVFGLLKK